MIKKSTTRTMHRTYKGMYCVGCDKKIEKLGFYVIVAKRYKVCVQCATMENPIGPNSKSDTA